MTKNDFLAAVQSHVARGAIGASTARTNPAGTVATARRYLRKFDLTVLRANHREFAAILNQETSRLQRALPLNGNSWGLSRKMLNIFLRDCLYNTYLEEKYKIRRLRSVMEIPLDGVTARALRAHAARGKLPEWPGVKRVTRGISAKYQAVATEVADREKVCRVQLDSVFWSQDRD